MAKTYYLRSTALANGIHVATNESEAGTAAGSGSGSQSITLGGGSDVLGWSWVTPANEPNNAAWPTGGGSVAYQCVFNITAIGSTSGVGLLTRGASAGHFARVNSGITSDLETHVQNESAFTTGGVKTATYTSTWSSGSASDRFECLIAASRSASHGNETTTIQVDNPSASAANGGIALGPWVFVYDETASGGGVGGGTGTETASYVIAASGGATGGGTATVGQVYNETGSGGAVGGGTAPVASTGEDDLLVAYVSWDGQNASPTWPTDHAWALLFHDDTSVSPTRTHECRWTLDDGTFPASATVVVTTSASEESAAAVIRAKAGTYDLPPQASANGSSFGGSSNPPSLTPSWGSAKTQWWALCTADDNSDGSTTLSTYPTNYSNKQHGDGTGGADHILHATASRDLEASSEDPGSFAWSASVGWFARTLGIQGAGGSFPTTAVSYSHETTNTTTHTLAIPDAISGNTYNETGSGTATGGGAAVDQASYVVDASGAASGGGSAAVGLVYANVDGSGTATGEGSAAVGLSYANIDASGGALGEGTSDVQAIYDPAPSGGAIGEGNADVVANYVDAGVGGADASGTADTIADYVDAGSGGAVGDGSALVGLSYANIDALGGAIGGGTADALAVYVEMGSGTAVGEGSAIDEYIPGGSGNTYDETGSGGALGEGSALVAAVYAELASGSAVADGVADAAAVYVEASSGEATAGGSAVESQAFDPSVSGGAVADGSADVMANYAIVAGGEALGGGVALVGYQYDEIASGGAVAGGTAQWEAPPVVVPVEEYFPRLPTTASVRVRNRRT